MRAAASAAVICAVALALGCDSENQGGIAHPRVLTGQIDRADLASLITRQPAHVDFLSTRVGFIGTGGGAILATRNGGATWAMRRRVPELADFDFVSPRRGFALTNRNVLWATGDAGRTWARVHRFPHARLSRSPGLTFVNAEHGWIGRATRLDRTLDGGADVGQAAVAVRGIRPSGRPELSRQPERFLGLRTPARGGISGEDALRDDERR